MEEIHDAVKSALGEGYEILRELGGGGMSRVFVAREISLGREVVVKVLPPDLAAELKADRFRREIQTAARLHHPHIVPLLAAGSSGSLLYYTMPYVDGPSLKKRLSGPDRLSVSECLAILSEVADALSYAHENGIVHRDVKPDNILLYASHALVLDFGVAKALTAAADDGTLTRTGLAIGTPLYISPEQALADPDVDGRADIYSLGVVAYEMLCSRPPFEGKSSQALMAAHVTLAPKELRALAPSVPGAIADVIMRCIKKSPADRWQSAVELRDNLEDLRARFTPARVLVANSAHAADDSGLQELRGELSPSPMDSPVNTVRSFLAVHRKPAIAALCLMAVGGFAILSNYKNRISNEISDGSVAVLPFANIDQPGHADYYSAGLTGEIRAALSKIDGVNVASSTSSSAFEGKPVDVRDIAHQLNVSSVVEGTLQRTGTDIRVTVQLTNAKTGYQIWSNEYNDRAANLLSVQSRIAEAIATALTGRLVPRKGHQLGQSTTTDPKAYDLFLKGQYLENDFTQESLDQALASYQLALSIDPRFARAYAAIADAYYHLADDYLPPKEAYPKVKAAASKAVALDSTLSDAFASLASYEVSYGWDWTAAKRDVDKSLELNPRSSFALMIAGWYSIIVGNVDEGVQSALMAASLDPLSDEIGGNVVSILRAAGRHDLAIAQVRRMIASNTGSPTTLRAWLSWEYVQLGQLPLAKLQLDTAFGIDSTCCKRTKALYLAHSGSPAEADKILQTIEAKRAKSYYRAEFLAEGRAALNDTTGMFKWLEQAYTDRSSGFPSFRYSSEISRFKDLPHFKQLVARLNLAAGPR